MFSKESLEFVYVLKEEGGGGQEQSPQRLRVGCGSDKMEEGWYRKEGWYIRGGVVFMEQINHTLL